MLSNTVHLSNVVHMLLTRYFLKYQNSASSPQVVPVCHHPVFIASVLIFYLTVSNLGTYLLIKVSEYKKSQDGTCEPMII